MRIALIAHALSPWAPRYARHFKAAGHAVAVFSFQAGSIDGIETVHVGRSKDPQVIPRVDYVTRAPRLRRLLREFAPDVVLATYLSSNGIVARLAWGGPLLVSARGGDVLDQAGNPPVPAWARRFLTRFACRRAFRVHSVSEEITEALVDLGIDPRRIMTFPAGVDLARFTPRAAPAPGVAPRRLIVTRWHGPVYRNDLIVEAAARLIAEGETVELTFVGGGALLDERRGQVRALGLEDRIDFVPQVEHAAMPALLRAADIYISASASDGTSSSLLEALATGLLPVVTRIRANTAWVRDGGNGFLFEEGNAEDLAVVLRRAIRDPGALSRAFEENPALVRERADERRNSDRLLAMLSEAATAPRRAGMPPA